MTLKLGNQSIKHLDHLAPHFDGIMDSGCVLAVVGNESGSKVSCEASQGHLRSKIYQRREILQFSEDSRVVHPVDVGRKQYAMLANVFRCSQRPRAISLYLL